MSRCYNTDIDTGLSKQSSKTYKVIRQKSNAELNEKLRRLDMEHNSNIAKILNERYNLRTLHFNLMHSSGESASDSDSEGTAELDLSSLLAEDTEDFQAQEKNTHSVTSDNNTKKQTFLQLPSIIEDPRSYLKQQSKSPKLGRSPLPPLSEHGFTTRVRKTSESTLLNPSPVWSRQRSSSFPGGQMHMPGERQRNSEFKRSTKHEKPTQGDGKRVSEDKPSQPDTEKSTPKVVVSMSWNSELQDCRYLRRKRYSTPDIIDTDSLFDKTPDK
ncbi:uncharacterized protein LOC114961980 [Acropora millepora]|uniref:uncharacterized protein LOC114961980 n=1 Tax=Acropora millepora TaxID=45264 RepID=UPI001CF11D2C|nr:uncharacterized protein LOC114961980 [Acropora millepora]